MFKLRSALAAFAIATAGMGTLTAATAGTAAAAPPRPTVTPVLTQVTAAHHPGYDRLVFTFKGGIPNEKVQYVSQVTADPSGRPVNVVGTSRLLVTFTPATGHTARGAVTYGPTTRAFSLPEIIQVAQAGDFEHVLSFGVGVTQVAFTHVFTLANPSRVVVDLGTTPQTATVRDYFLNTHRYAHVQAVNRQVMAPTVTPVTATAALQRLFAGPTQAELAQGLRFVSSGATGFKNLSISGGVAKVQLTGNLSSRGSAYTIANEIMPTLKQFPGVRWVKIYDQYGHTLRPYGNIDSIPLSLA